jgi:hypothetical protein
MSNKKKILFLFTLACSAVIPAWLYDELGGPRGEVTLTTMISMLAAAGRALGTLRIARARECLRGGGVWS